MEEKEFITMLEDLIYSEQELSDDYSKATNKAIDLLNKLKAKQLSIPDVSDMFDFASYLDYKFDYYDNTKLGDIYINSVTGKKFTQEQIYKDWLKQK